MSALEISNSEDVLLKEFDGISALRLAVNYLDVHALIAIFFAVSFTIAVSLAIFIFDRSNAAKFWKTFWIEFGYMMACSTFGVVTAFFLSLGLKRGPDGHSSNGLIESFAAPFISLLTAGAAILIARSSQGGDSGRRSIICAACFLCAAAVSYRTFFYQIFTAY